MSLHVTDQVSFHAGIGQCLSDRVSLAVNAGGSVTGFFRAVIVDSRAFDDGMDCVAIRKCVRQTFQHQNPAAAAEYSAVSLRIKCADVAVWRNDAARIAEVAGAVRYAHRYRAREGHVGLLR